MCVNNLYLQAKARTLDVLRQLDLWDDVENCCRYGRRVVIKMPQQSDEETEGTLSSARKRKM